MSTRSIKLKMLLRVAGADGKTDKAATARLRRAVWATHEFVNDAAAAYAQLLLELRQEDVCTGVDDDRRDVIVPAAAWQARLRARLLANNLSAAAVEEAVPLLKRLYGEIVPSFLVKGAGDAQAANAFASPLVDANSLGGEAKAAKAGALSELIACRDQPLELWRDQAQAVIKANRDTLLNAPGRKAGWAEAYLEGADGSAWQPKLKKLLDDLAKAEAGGTASVLPAVRAAGALPLMPPVGKGRVQASGTLSKHERVGLANAAAALNAWESKRFDMQAARDKLVERVANWQRDFLPGYQAALDAIRALEAAETDRLRAEALGNEATDYRIRPRELRTSWQRLREWLAKHPGATDDEAEAQVRTLQAELGRQFGSHRLLSWLAAPQQRWLAIHADGDAVTRIAVYNELLRKLERARQLPIWTGADAVRHPRFAPFDPPANTNAPGFELEQRREGALTLTLSLLAPDPKDKGMLTPTDFAVDLVSSRQAAHPALSGAKNEKNKLVQSLHWRDPRGGPALGGKVGGSSLLLKRKVLESRARPELREGAFGPAWFKLSVDVAAETETQEQAKARSAVRGWLSAGLAARADPNAKNRPPEPGTRVLAVDLGLRTAVSLSVWRIVAASEAPARARDGRPGWRIDLGQGIAAVHERSAQLPLPGEVVDANAALARRARMGEVRELLAALTHLGNLFKASRATEPDRRREWLDRLGEGEDSARAKAKERLTPAEHATLTALADGAQEPWQAACTAVWHRLDQAMAGHISEWRRASRRRTHAARTTAYGPTQFERLAAGQYLAFITQADRARRAAAELDPQGGKSAWQIDYLELVRKTLLRWQCRQRPGDETVRRMPFKELGKFAGRLLDHLTRLREDRAKTTAALIVSAARGFTRDRAPGPKGGRADRDSWVQRFPVCQYVVLEDLSRYRFKTDRPKADNRQLMKWVHREVERLTVMQAEVHGIRIASTGAAFTSKFDARTSTPGVRCTIVDKDLHARLQAGEAPWLDHLLTDLGLLAVDVRLGDLLPTGSGDQFASVDRDGRLRVRHADLNAAQGLAVRALTGHADIVRLSMRRFALADGGHAFVVARPLSALSSGAIQRLVGGAVPAKVA
ncbi:MAG: type V CRISPR-associated protein Cas12b, partial [Deltaproteobacteria bacterium]|nr:type V CRISPR-associated protein Cas12b [Deltaproteobacteria bacterium]